MNPSVAAPTPIPLRDIAGPVAFFPYPLWMVVAAGLVVLALIGGLVWFLALRRRPTLRITPAARALAALERLRATVDETEPYAFSIGASDILREYVRDAYGLSAPTQTSREFLETVRGRNLFDENASAALAGFLDKADLIKFARLHATVADSRALLEQAEMLVRAGAGAGRPEEVPA